MKIEEIVGPVITVAFLVGLGVEALAPARKFPAVRGWRALGLVFFFVSAGINIGLPLLVPEAWLLEHSLLPGQRLGVAGGFAVGFLVFGCVYYWFHRLEHRITPAWRLLHQLHHSPPRVDVSGFAFTHPAEMVVQTLLALAVNLGVLGLDPRAAALVGLYGALAAVTQHLNVRTPAWLEWFVQRPEAHVRHHETDVHAFNYADWPVWDKLFGTYRAPSAQEVPVGFAPVASRRIGAMLAGVDVSAA